MQTFQDQIEPFVPKTPVYIPSKIKPQTPSSRPVQSADLPVQSADLIVQPKWQAEKQSFVNSYASSMKINKNLVVPFAHWMHQWKNLHLQYKSVMVQSLVFNFFLKRKLHLNIFFYHKYHGGLRLVGNTFGFYNPKLPKLLKKHIKRASFLKKKLSFRHSRGKNALKRSRSIIFRKSSKVLKEFLYNFKHKSKFDNLAKALLSYNNAPKLCMCFTHYYLPKTYIVAGSDSAFFRLKRMQNFWHGLQLLRLIVENKTTAQTLARFVYLSVRRNPKRAAFIMHLKRLIDWHFAAAESLKIQGVRIEVKGRFNAKSRARKYILSVGRVAKQEKTSNVDYAFIEAITPFGSLAIKVWVCPEERILQITKNVINTTQNKVSKSTQRSHQRL